MPGSAGLSGDWLSIRDSSWKRSGLSSPPPLATIDKTDAGGLATVLWEIAQASGVGVIVEEERITLRQEVR